MTHLVEVFLPATADHAHRIIQAPPHIEPPQVSPAGQVASIPCAESKPPLEALMLIFDILGVTEHAGVHDLESHERSMQSSKLESRANAIAQRATEIDEHQRA